MNIKYYAKSSGKIPVKEDIDKLSMAEKADFLSRINGISKYGLNYSRVIFKQVKGKLWEIKYKYKNQHRVLYFMQESETIILLHYIKKKTQKLEMKDINLGEKRMMEVLKWQINT